MSACHLLCYRRINAVHCVSINLYLAHRIPAELAIGSFLWMLWQHKKVSFPKPEADFFICYGDKENAPCLHGSI